MTPAEKQRAYRERRKAGRFVVRVECNEGILDSLERRGLVTPATSCDPAKVGEAIGKLINSVTCNTGR